MRKIHSFHIPVMGLGFTVDTPIKVAAYGMDSVMTIGDDRLNEKLRKVYCEQYGLKYKEITNTDDDYRARRITAYLNLINDVVKDKFAQYIHSPTENREEIEKYIDLLPEDSRAKRGFHALIADSFDPDKVGEWISKNLTLGSLDVNIMTKIDKDYYDKNEKLPVENNDAHVSVRGYARSNLSSSLVLSAGLNPRLFTYMEQFCDFFPDDNGKIKKKIVLKVSDYRSAIIQGKFLAKRGLWVSEYRIESGLNCGGHAFATEGYLLGPILAEFRENREELINSVYEHVELAFEEKGISVSKIDLPFKITAQGGVGTAEEHKFLIDKYNLDSIGWGTPFLLVPSVTNIDEETLARLADAKEEDLYLSGISPLGVPFNSLRDTTKDHERLSRIERGRPGSPCVEGHLELFNTEFTERPVCTASRQYQNLKIKELSTEKLSPALHQAAYDKIVEKTCLCTGLVTSTLLVNNLKIGSGGAGVAVCPGPNMAYFSKVMNLKEITDHIYGRANVIARTDRPNMFLKELNIYLDFLIGKIEEVGDSMTKKQEKYLVNFSSNLKEGIGFYYKMFNSSKEVFASTKTSIISELDSSSLVLKNLVEIIERLKLSAPVNR